MKTLLSALMLVLATAKLSAQNIDWAFPTWPVGSSYVLAIDGGENERHVIAGQDALGYRIDAFGPDGTLIYNFWITKEGATTAIQFAGEQEPLRYVPNDCSVTLGLCSYREQYGTDMPIEMIRETTRTPDGVDYVIRYASGEPYLSGHWTLVADGFVLVSEFVTPDGAKGGSRMIGDPVKAVPPG